MGLPRLLPGRRPGDAGDRGVNHHPRDERVPPGWPSDSASAVSKNGPRQPTPGDLGPLDALIERVTNLLAAKIAAHLQNGQPPPVVDRWLTPQQAAELLQRPVGYVYKHTRALGGVHLSPRVVRFSQAALHRRMERAG